MEDRGRPLQTVGGRFYKQVNLLMRLAVGWPRDE